MKSIVILIFACIITSSCTIEKRVHRRGWNVQWHMKDRVSKTENEKVRKVEGRIQGSDLANEIKNERKRQAELSETLATTIEESKRTESTANSFSDEDHLKDQEPYQIAIETIDKAAANEDANFGKNRTTSKGKGGEKTGIVFMIVGGLVLLGGLGMIIGAAAAANLSTIVLLIAVGIVVGLIGLTLLIIGIVLFASFRKSQS